MPYAVETNWVKTHTSIKDFYAIPYWDRVRIDQIDESNLDQNESLHLWSYPVNKDSYILSQVVVIDGVVRKYELLHVTIHGYRRSDRSWGYKNYSPIRQIWFD